MVAAIAARYARSLGQRAVVRQWAGHRQGPPIRCRTDGLRFPFGLSRGRGRTRLMDVLSPRILFPASRTLDSCHRDVPFVGCVGAAGCSALSGAERLLAVLFRSFCADGRRHPESVMRSCERRERLQVIPHCLCVNQIRVRVSFVVTRPRLARHSSLSACHFLDCVLDLAKVSTMLTKVPA
jgi:hypothetical protein